MGLSRRNGSAACGWYTCFTPDSSESRPLKLAAEYPTVDHTVMNVQRPGYLHPLFHRSKRTVFRTSACSRLESIHIQPRRQTNRTTRKRLQTCPRIHRSPQGSCLLREPMAAQLHVPPTLQRPGASSLQAVAGTPELGRRVAHTVQHHQYKMLQLPRCCSVHALLRYRGGCGGSCTRS